MLVENELIVEYIATNFRQTLKVGDNVSKYSNLLIISSYCCCRDTNLLIINLLINCKLQLERTALHYSMGINNVEAISRILIKNGAKRVLKDLKGRTASFYYMNKEDIARLQEEEKV